MIEEGPKVAKIIPFPPTEELAEVRRSGYQVTIGRHHYRIRPHSLMASVWHWVQELWE